MPALPGTGLGDRPPDAPRELPSGFEFRIKWSGNILSMVGTIFLFVGLVLFFAMLFVIWFGALFALIFVILGFILFRAGRVQAKSVLRAFKRGIAIAGEVISCSLDRTQSINQEHPFKLVYSFVVDGHLYEGSLTSFDSTIARRAAGQPIWVLYVPEAPGQNTIYPPVR